MKKLMAVLLLGLAAATVQAKDVNCSKLGDEHARQNCREHQYDKKDKDKGEINCQKLDSKDGRKECQNFKYDDKKYPNKANNAHELDCRKTATTKEGFERCMRNGPGR